ncbi:unnamed protein product [Lactuca saligna]|uniref:Uncharacterized protein n=1 Tax=Lactuca saligna TaxID=75948 RepID=A0AA35ZUK1_LACSI|nr:unnamed protein product [Lactuca saligna]
MHKLYKANGERPLKIVFGVNTNMPIGEMYECFIREVGSHKWRDIGFHKDTWTEVSKAERIGMLQYLLRWFDFDAITNHPMASTYWASLNNQICARYRGRKNIAKNRFDDFAGNVEAARVQAPRGMDQQRWNAAIDNFLTEKHEKRSAGNKEFRKKQDVNVNTFLQNPAFVTAIGDIIRSFKNQVNEENNDGEDGGKAKTTSISCFMIWRIDTFRDDYDQLRRRGPLASIAGKTPAGGRNINRDDTIRDGNGVLGTTCIRDDIGLLATSQLRCRFSDDMSSLIPLATTDVINCDDFCRC